MWSSSGEGRGGHPWRRWAHEVQESWRKGVQAHFAPDTEVAVIVPADYQVEDDKPGGAEAGN